jgi:hypothetical protein
MTEDYVLDKKKGEKRGNKNVEHIISLIKSYIGEMHNPSLISLVAQVRSKI